MQESDAKKEKPKGSPKFSREQYEMLLRCSQKKDMTEWNQWRIENLNKDILLEGADLEGAWLSGADLALARLQGAWLYRAHLEDATLDNAGLQGANLNFSYLNGARLVETCLQRAKLISADLRGAQLSRARLQGAMFQSVLVDGSTLIYKCNADRRTDFRVVGLDSARVDSGLKQLLKCNARRMNWEEWYGAHSFKNWVVRRFWLQSRYGKCNSFWESAVRWWRLLSHFCESNPLLKRFVARLRYAAAHIKRSPIWKSPVWWFWWMSDYGRSTRRIIAVFFTLAFLFAAVYWLWGLAWPPGIVEKLFMDKDGPFPAYELPFRAIYFSIVTMTTLGFGDMYAAPRTVGYLFLTIQVLLGYVLLGALVTRFAVLFQGEGPAGDFEPDKKGPKPWEKVARRDRKRR